MPAAGRERKRSKGGCRRGRSRLAWRAVTRLSKALSPGCCSRRRRWRVRGTCGRWFARPVASTYCRRARDGAVEGIRVGGAGTGISRRTWVGPGSTYQAPDSSEVTLGDCLQP
jgi:hypothetical protein